MNWSLILSVLLLATGVLSQRRRPVIVRVVNNYYNSRPFAPRFRPRPLPAAGVIGALAGFAAASSVFAPRYRPFYPPPYPPYYGFYRRPVTSREPHRGDGEAKK